jgi:hypothetical protein
VKYDVTRPVNELSAEGAGGGDAGAAADPGPPPVMPPHEQPASAVALTSVKAVRQQRRRDAPPGFTLTMPSAPPHRYSKRTVADQRQAGAISTAQSGAISPEVEAAGVRGASGSPGLSPAFCAAANDARAEEHRPLGMIPKSGYRFSEQIMLHQ